MVQTLNQIIRFVFVGALAVGVDFVVYFGLLFIAPIIPIPLSKAISYISGATVSFVGHRSFVFQAQNHHPRHQILPFIILYASSLIANNLANQVVLNLTQIKVLAWFTAICTSTSMNYLGMKFGVFKKSQTPFTS
ncbi:MAG: GtrA-like protein [Microgenomates group bacterium Gr01-1014_16]|nr:MAG: GtrA-like protein [Microgenomates group bacterium Gr01-1014_16]